MSYKQQFVQDKQWYIDNWDWVLNGSYDEEDYLQAKNQYNKAMSMTEGRKAQALRRIVINGFTTLVSKELGCSYGHAQKIIVDTIPYNNLGNLTAYFVDGLPDILD